MAKKVQAGKRFKYNLQTVLKVREIREKKEQEKFAEKQRAYDKEKRKEEELKDEQRSRHSELREILGGGAIGNFGEVLNRKAHLGVLKEEVEKQIDKVIEASRILEDQRDKLIESMKKKKIMLKDRSNKHEKYDLVMAQLEMKFLDELATQRFIHEKQREQNK